MPSATKRALEQPLFTMIVESFLYSIIIIALLCVCIWTIKNETIILKVTLVVYKLVLSKASFIVTHNMTCLQVHFSCSFDTLIVDMHNCWGVFWAFLN